MKVMKKIVLLVSIVMVFLMSGCAAKPKEEKIKEDVQTLWEKEGLNEKAEIDSIEITDKIEDKENKTMLYYLTVNSSNDAVAYEMYYTLLYQKEEEGWECADLQRDSDKEWTNRPLQGVDEDTLKTYIRGTEVMVDEETWVITEEEITDLYVMEHQTDLEHQKDMITVKVTLKDVVIQAEGTIEITCTFENEKWVKEQASEKEAFVSTMIPEMVLSMTENQLMEELNGKAFELTAKKESRLEEPEENSRRNMVTITKDKLSDFKIDRQESSNRGKHQTYYCSVILDKEYANFAVEMVIDYYYSDEWQLQSIPITYTATVNDLTGEWSGKFRDVPKDGTSVLQITDIDKDGNISGIYSYAESESYYHSQSGSYYFSGKIDMATLQMNLEDGEWIKEPSSRSILYKKTDIVAYLNLDEKMIEGSGQGNKYFKVVKQN